MNNSFDFKNTPLFDTISRLREIYESSPTYVALVELQNKLDTVRVPMDGALEASKAFQEVIKSYNYSNSPALDNFQSIIQNVSAAATASNAMHLHSAIDVLKDIDFSALTSIEATSRIMDSIPSDITFDTVSELIENGEITDDDLQAELKSTITGSENEASKGKPSKIQKALKFIAIQLILFIIATVFSPVTDTVKSELVEAFRINEFWQNTGIIDWIESWSNDSHAATEDEAKATVDESKTGNISKQKRDDLLRKIEEIRKYISNAPQDENTGNLLSYLSEIEKDVNGKKYGLVFEEHREDIDEVLETHTPVLSEEADLFIDNGGQMNFLIEGDNLASLKLLEKTHKSRIDLIYIDPPYNTGNNDFIYDDSFVEKTDGFRHSKWISFIAGRLKLARKLLSNNGVIAISVGYQEVNNLMLLCQELFYDKNVTSVTVQTSGGKPNGGFNVTYEFVVFITPVDFLPNASEAAMNDYASPYHGMNLATFDQTQRPGQVYPIFVDGNGVFVGCGKTLTERIKSGEYNGEMADFSFDYGEAPTGTVAIWPVTRKGIPCVWRLIPSRLAKDWEKGYIKILPQNPGKTQNLYTIQYLSDGIIKKIKSGELITHRAFENERIPTLDVDNYKTAGATIQTIWTDKAFYTTNGGNEMADILGSKKAFSYPKPLAIVFEIVQRITKDNFIILDFFAGSGTTGHAVMKLNAEDGGNRRFIICTNNENNICRDVTYERIKRVIEKDNYSASLKYYKVEYLPISERLYYEYADELLLHIRELVELENGINFIGNSEIAIVLTDEELNDFTQNIEQYSACRKLYMGHDLLPDEEQERIITENDIEVSIIPDYYYKDLQEE